MSIEFSNTELTELTPKIIVVGVGGAGGNAVNNMIAAELQGVDFVVANTDAQALANAKTGNRIQLGVESTRGLGAGAQPKVGEAAAEEAIDQIEETLEGAHMAFITAGMGGGTGTGAAPVVARMAKEKGILTVGVVTKPFQFEGTRRMKMADAGLKALSEHVDALIIIPNQNLFCLATEKTTFADAFQMADQVLHSGVRGITDLIVMPGLINLDFADVRTVMSAMGKAMMGTGEAEGESRAIEAAQAAIANPLLEDVSLNGARAVIINITGGMDMTLHEVDEAANLVRSQVDPDADIIVGSAFNQDMNGRIRVSVVATGIEGGELSLTRIERRAPTPIGDPAPVVEEVEELQDVSDDVAAFEEMEEEASAESHEDNSNDAGDEQNFEETVLDDIANEPADAPLDLSGAAVDEEWKQEAPVPEALLEDDQFSGEESVEAVEHEVSDGPEADSFDEEKVIEANRDDAFVMEAHKEPSLSAAPSSAPDMGAADAYAAEPAAEEPAPVEEKTGGLSFFRKLTASTRQAAAEESSAPEDVNEVNESGGGGTGGMASDDKPSLTSDDNDQLEIPAFLRRQSN